MYSMKAQQQLHVVLRNNLECHIRLDIPADRIIVKL